MKRIIIWSLLTLTTLPVFSQSKAKNLITVTEGRQEFLKRNYWGALDLYRKAYKVDPENALINFRIGETQYALKHYDIAKEYLERAKKLDGKVDSEIDLKLGYTYHRLAMLEEAKEQYRIFRGESSKAKANRGNLTGLISQCEYAEEMMAAPVNVEIKNLSKEINSRFDDYAPSVTADGQKLVFTSRRPSVSNAIDKRGDHKYFEDIYYSEWNAEDARWETAERFSRNVNSPTHDAVLSINGKGDEIFIYKNDVGHAGDIFKSRLSGDWSVPEKLPKPINTSYFESSVSVTGDGNTMYFISERPSGYGRGDIYMSQRMSEERWSKPVNLGEIINTSADEKFVFIHPNGSTLFFSSNGHLSMGSYDIFRSEYKNGKWSIPVNLGYPINTVNEESTFSMTADNKKLMISAEYKNGIGERDIYEIDISKTDILHSLNIDSELLTQIRNVIVYGQVTTDSGKKPGAFIDIKVYDQKDEKEVFNTRTDRRGNYELNLPRGQVYQMSIQSGPGLIKKEKVNLKSLPENESELFRDIDL